MEETYKLVIMAERSTSESVIPGYDKGDMTRTEAKNSRSNDGHNPVDGCLC